MKFDEITKYLDSVVSDWKVPSVDCVIFQNHKQIYRHFAGTVDEKRCKPIEGNEQYLMFSMTKVITMTAIMQLVESGKLSLEDEVEKYLPAYRNIMVKDMEGAPSPIPMDAPMETIAMHPAKNKLRIKHLLSMQSGLDYNLERGGIKEVLADKGEAATTREIVDSFVKTPFDFEPGTRFQYSLSHDVAAAVVEVISGMSFGDYLKKNIFEPLKMNNTFFAKPMNDDVEGLASQYIYNESDRSILLMEKSCNYQLSASYESGGAGLCSCTMDYIRLADTLACGGMSADGIRILKPETVELMKKDLLGEASHKDLENNMGRFGYDYGCGVAVFARPEEVNSPAAAGVFGWDGAAGSMITMDTVRNISVVFTMHVRGFGPVYGEIHPHLRDLVFEV